MEKNVSTIRSKNRQANSMHSIRILLFVLFLIFSFTPTNSDGQTDNRKEDVMTAPHSPATGQKVSHPSLGYSCTIPRGWVYNQTAAGTILGHNSIPGMIIISPHMQPDLMHLQSELTKGIRENDIALALSGSLQNLAPNVLSGEYYGTLGGQEVVARGFGILDANGGGTYVLALSLPGELSKHLTDAASILATSMHFTPSRTEEDSTSPLIGTWKDVRGGGHTIMTLAENGTFTYYSDYSASGNGWGYTNADTSQGNWQSRGTSQSGTIFYKTDAGEQGSMAYQVLVENGQVYWNEYIFDGTLYVRQ